jgi:hypothetical protein
MSKGLEARNMNRSLLLADKNPQTIVFLRHLPSLAVDPRHAAVFRRD